MAKAERTDLSNVFGVYLSKHIQGKGPSNEMIDEEMSVEGRKRQWIIPATERGGGKIMMAMRKRAAIV